MEAGGSFALALNAAMIAEINHQSTHRRAEKKQCHDFRYSRSSSSEATKAEDGGGNCDD